MIQLVKIRTTSCADEGTLRVGSITISVLLILTLAIDLPAQLTYLAGSWRVRHQETIDYNKIRLNEFG